MEDNLPFFDVNSSDNVLTNYQKLSLTAKYYINNLIKENNLKLYCISVKNISTNGGNYFGVLQAVDIKGTAKNSDKEIHLFVKNIIDATEAFNHSLISEVYLRESFVYKELLTIYDNFQAEHKVPMDERYNIVKNFNDVNSEVIILENMNKEGYETCDRRDVISLKFGEISIAQLAKFHALSFVLQEKRPLYFKEKIKVMKNIINFDSGWQLFIRKVHDTAILGVEGEARKKLASYYPILLKNYEEYFRMPEEDSVCLCHGDFRPNNILLKKFDGEVSKVFVIDYQFVNYSSPVFDFIYFIFVGTDQEFRDTHLNYLKDCYYDNFDKYLRYFGIKSSDVYPKNRFEQDFRKKMDLGLLVFLVLMPFIFAGEDNVPDINEISQANSFHLEKGYEKRLREIVDFFIQEGYL